MSVTIKTMRILSIAALLCLPLPQVATAQAGAGFEIKRNLSKEKISKLDSITAHAEKGDSAAQMMLGTMYFFGDGAPHDVEKGLEWLQKSAMEGNDAYAQFLMGVFYGSDDVPGVQQDKEQARQWLQKAINQGFSKASEALKDLNDNTPPPSMDALTASAENGDAKAQFTLAYHYLQGSNGLERSRNNFAKWISKSAEGGNDRAQFILGMKLLEAHRLNDGLIWLQRAATQKNMDAQYRLGVLHVVSAHPQARMGTGLGLLHEAAEQGDPRAQRLLRTIAAEGWGGRRFGREEEEIFIP